MRLIDGDTKITALLYNDEHEETERVEMSIADFLDGHTEEGCPQTVGGWISVKDRLPENAKHPGAFCPRYLVYTDYGITEGWYNPDKECWYGYVSFIVDSNELDVRNINLERGDIPKRVKNLPVKYWMPFPEQPKEEENDRT
jgi:hypothetical protein